MAVPLRNDQEQLTTADLAKGPNRAAPTHNRVPRPQTGCVCKKRRGTNRDSSRRFDSAISWQRTRWSARALEGDSDRVCRRAAQGGRAGRRAGGTSHAAPSRGLCRGALQARSAMGSRRRCFHRRPAPCLPSISQLLRSSAVGLVDPSGRKQSFLTPQRLSGTEISLCVATSLW